jgi:hypothetical protein
MIKVFIDTEFNEFQGELISMALVAETGEEFYEVLPCEKPGVWVSQHVMPFLEKEPITKELFQVKLQNFLIQFMGRGGLTIVSDWPDDIKYFCESLIVGPGVAISHPPMGFILDRNLSSGHSKVPHNALYDARAIADMYLSKEYGH